MSPLVARLLLTIFMIPLSGLMYLISYFVISENWRRYPNEISPTLSGALMWAFMAIYWVLLWRKTVRWNSSRVSKSVIFAGAALLMGILIGYLCYMLDRGFGMFIGSVTAPLLWLVATIFVWRDKPSERTISGPIMGQEGIACPACGYNLSGLSELRCPECGTRYTIDQLLAAQPSRIAAELK